MTFGEKLQSLRKERKISQENLSEKINVSRQTVSKWENNLVVPDTDNLVALSKYFNVPLEFFLSDDCEYRKESVPPCEKNEMEAEKKTFPRVCILSGISFILLSVCGTYVIQYFDMSINGSCYTNAFNYLWDLPLLITLLTGILLIGIGVMRSKKL